MMWMMMVVACSLVTVMVEYDSTVKVVKQAKAASNPVDGASGRSNSQASSLAGQQGKS